MINEKRLLDTFLEYVQIDSETKNEKAMGERLVQDLKALGFEVQTDRAGEAFGSNGFNVHAFLEGTIPGDPTIFCAHMDTVAPGNGIRPVIKGSAPQKCRHPLYHRRRGRDERREKYGLFHA